MNRHRLAAGIAAMLIVSASLKAADPQGITEVRSVEGITEYQLGNGMKVLLFPDESKPKVTVNLTLFVGSRHEGYGETGMAHLLEHMMFKGTPTHPQVPKVLTERGADFNGTTWLDRTNYYETLPASDDNLEFAIRLEADRLINSNIKREDLASEMTVVRNEFEHGENTPSLILSQRIMAVAYEWHNYGKSTIGNRADIERVPVEKLRVFYKKYYQPDNAMLVVAGRFDVEKALAAIAKYFGVIPRPERKLDETYTEEPVQDGERFVTLRRVGDVSVVGAMYHISAGGHPDFASVEVLSDILTAAPAGRLYKALVQTKKASHVRAEVYALHDPGVIEFEVDVSQGNDPEGVVGVLLDVIEQVGEKGVTPEEVERGQRRLLKQRELDAADSGQIAIDLSEWAAQGDWRLYFLNRDRIEKVTPQSVQEVAAKYLKQSNRTVGIFFPTEKPDRSTVPQTPNLAETIGDYKGRQSAASGEAFDVSPASIEQRTKRLALPGGIKVALLKKATRNQAVNLQLTLRYGNEKNLRGLTTACEFLPDLMARGTKKLSRQQLQDALDGQSAELNANGEAGAATFSIETKRDNLPAALELLRQVLREPSLPDSELEILKRSRVSSLEKNRKEPGAIAPREVRRRAYPYPKDDPRYLPTLDEEIKMVQDLDRATIAKLYEGYLNGQHGELAIVGDFDEQAVMPIIEKALADWQAREPYERLKHTVIADKGAEADVLTPGKANAMYFALEGMPITDSHPDVPALVIGDFVFGGGSLSSRLADRIREQEGLSYGVRSGFQARSLDPRAAFYIYAIANPVNMPKVKTLIREELDRFLAKGITDKELRTGVAGYLQNQRVEWTSDGSLANVLADTSEAERTMQFYADLEQKILSLTPGDVQAAFRRHIDPKRLIVVTAGDFQPGADDKKPDAAGK